jgi:YaiO family outer membrane protein
MRTPASVLLSVLFLHVASSAAAREQPFQPESCKQAQQAFVTGQITQALQAAEQCVIVAPEFAEHHFLQARILAAGHDYESAMVALEKAMAIAPGNNDLYAWQVRLVAWDGRLDEAWTRLQLLPDYAFEDPEVERLAADLAYWQHNWPEATRRYDAYLAAHPEDDSARRKRALVHLERGDLDGAEQDFKELCQAESKGGSSCLELRELQRQRRNVSITLLPEYLMRDAGQFGYDLFARIEGSPLHKLKLHAEVDYRTRDFGKGDLTDPYIRAGAVVMPTPRLSLGLAGGFTPSADFSPEWTAEAEVGYKIIDNLTAYVKYWRIEFDDGGANVITPRASWYVGPLLFDARYYLTLQEGKTTGHSVLGIGHYLFGPFDLHVGGGGGDRSDYLEVLAGETDQFVLALAGASWDVTALHRIQFDYVYRNEASGERDFNLHQFTAGYRVSF